MNFNGKVLFMALKVLVCFTLKNILDNLSEFGKESYKLRTIVQFIFKPYVQDLIKNLNKQFDSKQGNRAYPRELLLGVLMYCSTLHIANLTGIARECKVNRVLQVFTCGETPSASTFKRFFQENNRLTLKKIFCCTLLEFNEETFLDFTRLFIDGTDALVNGSIHYKITWDEITMLQYAKQWKILHNNRKQSMERFITELKKKEEFYKDDAEITKLIQMALKRPDIYNKRIYKKIPLFTEALLGRKQDYVSIMFPESIMMRTKKGKFDFALNLQQIMLKNKIVFGGVLLDKPNDSKVLEEVLLDIQETIEILVDLQKKYGLRRNYDEIKGLLERTTFILDSGYFSDHNLEIADKYAINALIMPKVIARQRNNKIREENNLDKKNKNTKNDDKISKKQMKRVYNGYICPNNQKTEIISNKIINNDRNKRKGIPEHWKDRKYKFKFNCPNDCPFRHKCDHQVINDDISPLKYEMTNKFTNKRYLDMYNERFSESESINGYIKNTTGIFKLLTSDKKSAQKEIYIINMTYNLIRFNNIKGTAY